MNGNIYMLIELLKKGLEYDEEIRAEVEKNNVAKYFVEVGNYKATIEIKKKEE